MNDEKARAVTVLLSIAENESSDDDTRVRAACAVLDLHKFAEVEARVKTA